MNSNHFRGGWKYYASYPLHSNLLEILTCAQRTRLYFCPKHCLLCHLGLYKFEFEFALIKKLIRCTRPRAMMIVVQSGMLLHALRVRLKRHSSFEQNRHGKTGHLGFRTVIITIMVTKAFVPYKFLI